MHFHCPLFARKSFAGASTSKSRGLRILLSEAGCHQAGSGTSSCWPVVSWQPVLPRQLAVCRQLILLATLAALCTTFGLPAEAAADPSDDPPDGGGLLLPVFFIDSTGLPQGTLRAIKSEVAAQFAEIGVTVTEIDQEGMSSGSNIPEGLHLGVMLLGPTKDGWGHGGRTIGISTRAEPKHGYNTVYIFVPEVENTLSACSVRPYPNVVGKGAGRAAVHEIVHTLVPSLEHSDARMDIMAPTWTCNALMKAGISLNAEFAEAVRSKLAELTER